MGGRSDSKQLGRGAVGNLAAMARACGSVLENKAVYGGGRKWSRGKQSARVKREVKVTRTRCVNKNKQAQAMTVLTAIVKYAFSGSSPHSYTLENDQSSLPIYANGDNHILHETYSFFFCFKMHLKLLRRRHD